MARCVKSRHTPDEFMQVFDRMQSNIRTADQHLDFFVRNAIVVLAEERLGLAVYRPAAMVKVNLSAAITP